MYIFLLLVFLGLSQLNDVLCYYSWLSHIISCHFMKLMWEN